MSKADQIGFGLIAGALDSRAMVVVPLIPVAGQRIADLAAAVALFAPTFANVAHEALRIAHLDREFRLLGLAIAPEAGPHGIDVSLRELIGEALARGARALIIAHNHPCGDPTPSRADRIATRRLVEVARPLEIRLVDHLIFAGDDMISFRALGLL